MESECASEFTSKTTEIYLSSPKKTSTAFSSTFITPLTTGNSLFPAVDFLSSTSTALTPAVVGEKHYKTYLAAQSVFKKASSLERIVSLIGESELSASDQVVYKRFRLLQNYLTQNFFVVEVQSGKKGSYIKLEDTVSDVERILNGEFDIVDPQKLLFIGTLKEITNNG